MKKVFTFLALILLSGLLTAQTLNYSRVKMLVNQNQIVEILSLGVNLEHAYFSEDGHLIVEASSQELQKLSDHNFSYEVLIEDMSKYYVDRNLLPESHIDLHTGSLLTQTYPVPAGFSLGSLGGYCTYDECLDHLDNMHTLYPGLITAKEPVSDIYSVENRPIYLVKIANDTVAGDKPKIFYNGMIHAREPGGMQHLLFFMYYLLENYETDPAIQYLVDHAELYIVPVVNPDGYLYNQQTNPNGGGMWRKNRSVNAGGSFGVDLNRNFGYMWGYDNTGSSPNPSDATYRGTSPFSEPETQAVKELCQEISFTKALNYHSYSNLLLFPWGYISSFTTDHDLFSRHAQIMTSDNGYTYGPGSTTIYATNGGSDDWMYGDDLTKPRIFSYTPEIGSSNDGFWPQVNRIIPHCQENMYQSLMAGYLSMKYAEVKSKSFPVTKNLENYLSFEIERLGFQDGGEFTVSLEPLSENVLLTGEPILFQDMEIMETRTDSISFTLDPDISGGTPVDFLLGVDNGYFVKYDTIRIWFGITESVFFDNCNSMQNWTGNWGLSSLHYVSPPYSITDSPTGNYPNSGSRTVTTNSQIAIPDAAAAFLRFDARWDINGLAAYAQARISTNNGSTWTPLEGEHTRPALFSSISGTPIYNELQQDWVTEIIDISNYAGQNVLIRFHLASSSWGTFTADGFYFDELEIIAVPFTTPVNAQFEASETVILEGSEVNFTDLSTGEPDTWQWTFTGGDPFGSGDQNPTVLYGNPGNFDVQLTASNTLDSDTYLANGYILVLDSILCRPEVFAGNDTIILPTGNYTAIEATAENYQSLVWTTSGDGSFDANTILNATYTPGLNDIEQQMVYLTLTGIPIYEICDEVSHTLELAILDPTGTRFETTADFRVYPNPASAYINIVFSTGQSRGVLEIINLTGEVLLARNVDNLSSLNLNLENFRKGIYLLRYTTGDQVYVKKIVLMN